VSTVEPIYSSEYRAAAEQALETALSQVPAYHGWRKHDRPSSLDVLERYRAMPVLTKAYLRQYQPASFVPIGRQLNTALATGEIELVETSGSTADAVTNVWCQSWWDASEASSWKLHSALASAGLGSHREAILASPRCVGFVSEHDELSLEQRTLQKYLFLNEIADPAKWSDALCDRMLTELRRFEPTVLEANPSYLTVLCRYALRQHRQVYQPAAVTLTYENPSLIHLRHIAQVFQCPVISSYGSTEAGYVFVQCEAGQFHQNIEQCHVDFQPLAVRHGGPRIGRILVSTFHNPWRALLRFDMGDLVSLAAKPCPCGRREGLTLDAIEGRITNTTLASSGRLVTQSEVDALIAQVEGLEQYELIQRDRTTLIVRYVSTSSDGAAFGRKLGVLLRPCYGGEVEIVAEQVQTLSPVMGVKYRLARAQFEIDFESTLARNP
jgi:phenylacetate-CoA ligase